MKKLVALTVALALMLGLVGTMSAAPAVGGELIYGSGTEISGDWAHNTI